MKMTKIHYLLLEKHITTSPIFKQKAEYKFSGRTERRYRWDCVWSANIGGFLNELYEYLNNDHIDTALKKITNTK